MTSENFNIPEDVKFQMELDRMIFGTGYAMQDENSKWIRVEPMDVKIICDKRGKLKGYKIGGRKWLN